MHSALLPTPRASPPTFQLRAWLRVLRLEYQGDNLLTWFAASALAAVRGARVEVVWFVLGLVMLLLAQMGLELLDGYHDFIQGAHGRKDEGAQVWTGGSGVLAEGLLAPASIRRVAWVLGGLATVLFAIVTGGRTGAAGAEVGIFGAVCGAGWAMPPFKLSYRGLGEVTVAVVTGPLMAAEAWLVAAGNFDARALVLGVPFGCVELAMALAHGMVDREVDAMAGKRTLVVRIGDRAAAWGHTAALLAAFGSVVALVTTGVAPPSAMLALVAAPLAVRAVVRVNAVARDRSQLEAMVRSFPTYVLHAVMGLALIVALLAELARSRPLLSAGMLAAFAMTYAPVALVLRSRFARGVR